MAGLRPSPGSDTVSAATLLTNALVFTYFITRPPSNSQDSEASYILALSFTRSRDALLGECFAIELFCQRTFNLPYRPEASRQQYIRG